MSKTMIVTIGLSLLVAAVGVANSENERRRRPPQVALDACVDADQESSCSFEGRRGDTLDGTCQEIDRELACVPDDHRRRERARRGDDLSGHPEGE